MIENKNDLNPEYLKRFIGSVSFSFPYVNKNLCINIDKRYIVHKITKEEFIRNCINVAHYNMDGFIKEKLPSQYVKGLLSKVEITDFYTSHSNSEKVCETEGDVMGEVVHYMLELARQEQKNIEESKLFVEDSIALNQDLKYKKNGQYGKNA